MAADDKYQLAEELGYQTQLFRLWNPLPRGEAVWEALPRIRPLHPAFQNDGVYQLAEQRGYQTQSRAIWLPVARTTAVWEPITHVTDEWQPGFQDGERY